MIVSDIFYAKKRGVAHVFRSYQKTAAQLSNGAAV